MHTELARILPMFGSYEAYEKAFTTTAAAAGSGDEACAGTQGTGDAAEEDVVEMVKRGFKNLVCHAAIDFLYDLLAGAHDKGIKDAVRAASLKDAKWMEGSGLAPLRELFRLLTAHRAMVQIDGGPPAPEARTLKRYKSEVGDDDEG